MADFVQLMNTYSLDMSLLMQSFIYMKRFIISFIHQKNQLCNLEGLEYISSQSQHSLVICTQDEIIIKTAIFYLPFISFSRFYISYSSSRQQQQQFSFAFLYFNSKLKKILFAYKNLSLKYLLKFINHFVSLFYAVRVFQKKNLVRKSISTFFYAPQIASQLSQLRQRR